MITVINEKGNVAFINESECVSVVYNKEDRMVRASPIQHTADTGLPMNDMKFFDVVSVAYVNEAHPTSQIFQEDKKPAPKGDFENDKIMVLYEELDRIETEERERQKKEHPNWRSVQKAGSACRFINVAKSADIETVGQLLDFGRSDFEKLRHMGRKCADLVTQGLTNLYRIEKW